MMRPHPGNQRFSGSKPKQVLSKVEQRLAAKRFAGKRRTQELPNTYLVVDIETNGLSADIDEIIEIAAIKVCEGVNTDVIQALIRISGTIPSHIEKLTGITNAVLEKDGRDLSDVICEFSIFAGELPFVSHNITFDMSFLRKAYEKCSLSMPNNLCIDTLRMARKLLDDPPDYKLGTLLKYFNIEQADAHRGVGDCHGTKLLFDKLRSISAGET
jgi:DNA polymerase III alpha subunit (gram-positive type)